MLTRMPSHELSGWWVLFQVQHEEASDAHLRATSADGELVISGRDSDLDEDDDDPDDHEEGSG